MLTDLAPFDSGVRSITTSSGRQRKRMRGALPRSMPMPREPAVCRRWASSVKPAAQPRGIWQLVITRPDPRQPHLAAVRVTGHQQVGLDLSQREVRHVAQHQMKPIRPRIAHRQPVKEPIRFPQPRQVNCTSPRSNDCLESTAVTPNPAKISYQRPVDVSLHGEHAARVPLERESPPRKSWSSRSRVLRCCRQAPGCSRRRRE